jgi:hypothetical protein
MDKATGEKICNDCPNKGVCPLYGFPQFPQISRDSLTYLPCELYTCSFGKRAATIVYRAALEETIQPDRVFREENGTEIPLYKFQTEHKRNPYFQRYVDPEGKIYAAAVRTGLYRTAQEILLKKGEKEREKFFLPTSSNES